MGYRKIEIGTVKTTERIRKGKVQTIKLFTKFQKRTIINEVMKGTSRYDLNVVDVLDMYGVSAPVYYSWIRKGNSEPEIKRIFIKIKSGVDLIKLSDKLKEIEEIENVIFS
jgi:hypothetical protein